LKSLLPRGRATNPLWPADGSHFAAVSSTAEELIAAIGLEPQAAADRFMLPS